MEGKGRLTIFGATVLELMARRGIRQWVTLSEQLTEHGYKFSPARISNGVYGRNAVDKEFGRALAETLELNAKERAQLAYAYLFGQDKKVGEEYETSEVLSSY